MDIRFGSAQGLEILATDDSASGIFTTFYTGYDRAFVLPDEKEGPGGFAECLALNHGPRFRQVCARLGPFRELVLIARLGGEFAGGVNFFVTPLREHGAVTMNLNYVYVLPEFRGHGLLRRLIAACHELAEWLYPDAGPVVKFLEVNDPLLLTAEQYARDSAGAGIDQFDRVVVWARLGARIVDFPYVQPPLSATQQADTSLMLGVLADPEFRLTGGLLADHLERFFAVSVLKTGDLGTNRLAADQVAACREPASIRLLDPRPALSGKRRESDFPDIGFRESLAKAMNHRP